MHNTLPISELSEEKKENNFLGGKMKSLIGTLVTIALLSGCAFSTISRFSAEDAEGKENIVSNSSFDMVDEGSNMPQGWVVLNEQENNIIWDDESHDDEGKCLKVENTNDTANLVSDGFNIDPQSVYYSRCYIKSNKISKDPVIMHFIAFDRNGKKVNDYKKEVAVEEDWTLVELTTGFFDNSATLARIAVSIPEGSDDTSYWVDDIESYNVHKFAYRYQTN